MKVYARTIDPNEYHDSKRHRLEDGIKTNHVYQMGIRAIDLENPDKEHFKILFVSFESMRRAQGKIALTGALLDRDYKPALTIPLEMSGGIAQPAAGKKVELTTGEVSSVIDEGYVAELGDDTDFELEMFDMLNLNTPANQHELVSVGPTNR